ncbi:MAG: M20/M25/M40 family metallo-hydrolase, partial [Candidatus Eremiobacteraeota bacterium]|nr:M20/M25/M40 family metallo-hydrolase [Candidatus Eremiobacteraeota bacterium]
IGSSGKSPLVEELSKRIGPLAENPFTNAIVRDTMSLTSLRSGVGDPPKVNVIPSLAEATLDIRLLPDTDLPAFEAEIRRRLDGLEGVEFEVIYAMDTTPVSSWETPLFGSIEKAIKAEHPEAVVTPYLVPFGTDSNSFRLKGAKAYGFFPMILDANLIFSAHSDNERVPVAEFEPALRIYYRALKGYLSD